MKRFFVLCGLTAALSSCGQTTLPTVVADQTVALGTATSQAVKQSFGGTWQVTGTVPAWLRLSSSAGTGDVAFTVTAQRNEATPLAANQKTLSDTLNITWTSTDKTRSGTAHLTVTADQYTLTGRVLDAGQMSGSDVGVTSPGTGGAAQRFSSQEVAGIASQGILVTYRSAALKEAVLKDAGLGQSGGLSAQTLDAQTLDAQTLDTQTLQLQATASRQILQTLSVPQQAREPLTARTVLLRVPATAQALAQLSSDPNVVSAVPSMKLHALGTGAGQAITSQALALPVVPADQYANLQWAYKLLGYGAVWRDMEAGKYTRPITVAVIDTGVRYDHPDLAGKLYQSGDGALDVITDTANGDNDGVDTDATDPGTAARTEGSHGTHVTGIIAANWGQFTAPCSSCSSSGVVGASYLAPIKILPIRALDIKGYSADEDVIHALRYAAGLSVTISGKTYTNPHPAQVINLSLGGKMSATEAQPLCDAVQEASDAGALIFVAAGNAGTTTPYYPAACPAAVSVGSVSLSGASAPLHADYSSTYAQVMLSAPGGTGVATTFYNGATLNGQAYGDYIFSTSWNYKTGTPSYESMSGTSQAAPQASALAALLLSKGVTTSADSTLKRMIATATDLGAAGRDTQFGYGMINAAAALNAPAVSDTFGVRIQDGLGRSFQPALDSLGRFTAYLGDGSYQVIGGRDRNGNGVYGEIGEPSAAASAVLGPQNSVVNVGDLTPQ